MLWCMHHHQKTIFPISSHLLHTHLPCSGVADWWDHAYLLYMGAVNETIFISINDFVLHHNKKTSRLDRCGIYHLRVKGWKNMMRWVLTLAPPGSWGVHAFHRLTNVVGAVTVQSQTWWISRHTLKDTRTSVENQRELTHTHTQTLHKTLQEWGSLWWMLALNGREY